VVECVKNTDIRVRDIVKLSHRAVRPRCCYVFETVGLQMAAMLSSLHAGRSLVPKKIGGTHFC
jgi:hypothetical protein